MAGHGIIIVDAVHCVALLANTTSPFVVKIMSGIKSLHFQFITLHSMHERQATVDFYELLHHLQS
jgi:hypothetical protein